MLSLLPGYRVSSFGLLIPVHVLKYFGRFLARRQSDEDKSHNNGTDSIISFCCQQLQGKLSVIDHSEFKAP